MKCEDLPQPCAFCGGKLAVSKEPPAVFHTLPVCAEYGKMEPLDFLTAHRKKLEEAMS